MNLENHVKVKGNLVLSQDIKGAISHAVRLDHIPRIHSLFKYRVLYSNSAGQTVSMINPLNTKRRQLYLKTQFVLRSKHFLSCL